MVRYWNYDSGILVKALLLASVGTVSLAVCSFGAPRKIGDTYGGGHNSRYF